MSDRDLTPDQDESVRALLAAAKHTDPMPLEVTARLDDVLAGLVAEQREHHEHRAPVVTLASRRRRFASIGLAAAAAAVVGGVAITQVLPTLGLQSDSDSSTVSAESTDELRATQDDDAGDAGAAAPKESAEEPQALERNTAKSNSSTLDATSLLSLTSSSNLRVQLRAIQRRETASYLAASPTCPLPSAGSAPQVGITYDKIPGTLILSAPSAGRQRAEIYLCGETTPVRTVMISTRPRRP